MKLTVRHWRRILLATLILFILIVRFSPALGEWYALHVYPKLSMVLSSFSSLFPFALGDIFIFLSVAGVIVYPIFGRLKGIRWKYSLIRVGEYLLWVYVWFYSAWGMNYFRSDFYTRTETKPAEYTDTEFQTFLNTYIQQLNEAYVPVKWVESHKLDEEIKKGYEQIYERFGLCEPRGWQRAKTMLFSSFISKVGVSGYMGPFFCEFNLNGELLASQYPSVYAHEYAHLLGIANEAEANLYAYLVCTNSSDPQIRFSGYFSLFAHVLRNAVVFLSEEDYKELVESVRPEIIQLYKDRAAYWNEKYSPFIGEIQDTLYEWFLKGNKIRSGQRNYSEVIGLLLSLSAEEEFSL